MSCNHTSETGTLRLMNPATPDEGLCTRDLHSVWHPYAPPRLPSPPWLVREARGVHLWLQDGRCLIDGMSSWWAAIHGYRHPVLDRAAREQLERMSHVMFGGLTHRPAIELCETLLSHGPASASRVFLADSGSVSVEVAIKLALQYAHGQGRAARRKLLTVRGGYHGDTFGAMAVCDPVTGMHRLFQGVLSEHLFAPKPSRRFGERCEPQDLRELRALLEHEQEEIAAVIVEPIVQGAGGMWFYSADYLRELRALCDRHGILLIFDEIATGFGRTGELFACRHAGVEPDIMCLGKALTGGYMSLAAVLVSDRVCEGIARGEPGVLMHGPTFMANPLACSVALASIELLVRSDWQSQVRGIEAQLRAELERCRALPQVADVRTLGAIGVLELHQPVDMQRMQPAFVDAGVWLRPFGRLVYTMPPYIIEPDQLSQVTGAMYDVVSKI